MVTFELYVCVYLDNLIWRIILFMLGGLKILSLNKDFFFCFFVEISYLNED